MFRVTEDGAKDEVGKQGMDGSKRSGSCSQLNSSCKKERSERGANTQVCHQMILATVNLRQNHATSISSNSLDMTMQ